MNKPVAWMDENENVIFEKNWAYPIPLYTHPVKELTDEEIEQVWERCKRDNQKNTSLKEIMMYMARAILRKAQEK